MAKIITRTWKSPGPLGRPVKHVAYGYTFYRADGARERKVSSAWGTAQAALTALTARLEAIAAGQLGRPTERTFGAVATEYSATRRTRASAPSPATSASSSAGSSRRSGRI